MSQGVLHDLHDISWNVPLAHGRVDVPFEGYDRDMCGYFRYDLLVGGFKHFLFSIIYGIIPPIDYFFSRCLKPPTSLRCNRYNLWL
jgi:hypothetical protein